MAATTIIDRTVPHLSSGINFLLMCRASVFTDLDVDYVCIVTWIEKLSKLGLSLFRKENGSTLDYR